MGKAAGQGTCSHTPTLRPGSPKPNSLIQPPTPHSQAGARHCSRQPRLTGHWSWFHKRFFFDLGSPQDHRAYSCPNSPACIENEPPVSSRHNCSRSSASCKETKQGSLKGPKPQSLQGIACQDTPKMPPTALRAQDIKTSPKSPCS